MPRRARTFTIAVGGESVVVSLWTIRWIKSQVETVRVQMEAQPLPVVTGMTADVVAAVRARQDAASRAVEIAIEEELENRHPRPIKLTSEEAHEVHLILSSDAAAHAELLAEMFPDIAIPKSEPNDRELLCAALERHLRERGRLE